MPAQVGSVLPPNSMCMRMVQSSLRPYMVPVDDRDASLVFTGAWNSDSNGSFYEGTARYTNEIGASVEFTFVGTAIRWYGQNDVNFGAAEVYVDGVLAGR